LASRLAALPTWMRPMTTFSRKNSLISLALIGLYF